MKLGLRSGSGLSVASDLMQVVDTALVARELVGGQSGGVYCVPTSIVMLLLGGDEVIAPDKMVDVDEGVTVFGEFTSDCLERVRGEEVADDGRGLA